MLLVVDIGNTHTVLGLYEGAELIRHFRVASDRDRTEDELHVMLVNLIQLAGLEPETVQASILASVVPALTDVTVRAVRLAFGRESLVVGPGIKTGMPILYEQPKEVGADRVVNAISAYERVRGGVIVVDFGTATTFDCVSNRGEYMGGVIAPGVVISAEALFSRAAKLPRIEIVKPPRVLGRNTVNSMQSGIIYGYVGLVDGLIDMLTKEIGYPCATLATGGLASLIASESRSIDEVAPSLTLEGLRILYERNK
jgi:type III pantothenate kinase